MKCHSFSLFSANCSSTALYTTSVTQYSVKKNKAYTQIRISSINFFFQKPNNGVYCKTVALAGGKTGDRDGYEAQDKRRRM